MKSYSLNGKPLASCRIIYAEPPLSLSVDSNTQKTVGEDIGRFLSGENCACDFDKQSAEALARGMEELFGVAPKTLCASDALVQAGDILVGGGLGTLFALEDERSYACGVSESDGQAHMAVCGGSYGATWHAVEALLQAWDAAKQTGALDDLASVFAIRGRAPLKTVACLGDSITRGSQALPDGNGFGAPDGLTASFGGKATSIYFEQYLSYPANLQRTLWKTHLVMNFGRGLATMRNINPDPTTGPFYYQNTPAYEKCLSYSNRSDFAFDAVLIMLGTNDSGRDGGVKTWGEAQRQDYCAEAERLIAAISEGSPNAKFALMTVPHRCDSDKPSENDSVMRALQEETVSALAGKGYPIVCYDMGRYTADHLGVGHGDTREAEIEAHADYYNIRTETGKPDTTHPNYRGYIAIAKGVEGLIGYLLEDAETPKYLI